MRKDNHIEDADLDDEGGDGESELPEEKVQSTSRVNVQARRRLEELREEKMLRDMLDDDFDSYLAGY